MKPVTINGRKIGPGYPVYIVAEMSANHHQQFDRAVKIIEAAKGAGADAVKLQTFSADTHTINSEKACFRIEGGTPWDGRTLYDLYREAYMPWEWQPKLKAVADNLGIDLFSSAVDATSVEFLEKVGIPAYKLGSFEIVDLELIRKVARTGKPFMMATGMCTLSEIDEAVQSAREAGAEQILLLKCTSAYPALPQDINLRTIPHLAEAFQVPVGLSDHTLGISVPVASVVLGACVIEKHFTLSRSDPGPDSTFSLEPQELKALVEEVRTVEKALGGIHYGLSQSEAKSHVFRRSLFVVKDVGKGETFTSENVRCIRPGIGLHPRYLKEVIGSCASQNIESGTPMSWDLFIRRQPAE